MVFFWRRNPQHQRGGRIIAVPVDGSSNAREALDFAVSQLLSRPTDQLHLITVEEPAAGPYPAEVPECDSIAPPLNFIREHRSVVYEHVMAAKQVLHDNKQAACSMGVRPSRVTLVQLPSGGGASGVGDSLLRYADQSGANMLVLGSRGMTGFRRWFTSLLGLGSVSDYLMVHANCPVVVVRSGLPKQGSFKRD